MPSLEDLSKFRASFRNVGDEAKYLASQGVSFDDFALPGEDTDTASSLGNTAVAPPDDAPADEGLGGFDFNDLLASGDDSFDADSLVDDLVDNLPADSPDSGANTAPVQAADLGSPADLSADSAASTDAADDTVAVQTPDADNADAPDAQEDILYEIEDADLGDLADFGADDLPAFGDDPAPADDLAGVSDGISDGVGDLPSLEEILPEGLPPVSDGVGDLPSLEEILPEGLPPVEDGILPDDIPSDDGGDSIPSLDELSVDDDFSLGDLPEFAANGTPPALDLPDFGNTNDLPSLDDLPDDDGNNSIPSLDDILVDPDFSVDALPELGVADNRPPSLESLDDAFSEMPNAPSALSDDLSLLDDLPAFGSSGDLNALSPDNGDELPVPDIGGLDTDVVAGSADVDAPQSLEPEPLDSGFGDFDITGLDDILNKNAAGTKLNSDRVVTDDVEEISLTEEEYEHLEAALDSYPLNLRIACEELIAEEAVAPDQMSKLIKLLVKEASAQEVAELAGKIQGRIINIPKGFEKKAGLDLEAEKNSFRYLFVHKFLPVLGFTIFGILVALSIVYLIYHFVYIPIQADNIYKSGYASIDAGQYELANDKFSQAFKLHPIKKWFSPYAEAFVKKRQYIHAEKKYEDLLKYYPKEKQGALDYAALETNQLQNYEKADSILRKYILDFTLNDKDALLALGDNALAWGDIDPSKYETAREAYARYIQAWGQTDPVLERMLKYFMKTDNLKEVLPLKEYFTDPLMVKKRKISPETFAEMGGYLLDKQLTETDGVRDEYINEIGGMRDILLQAVDKAPDLPEAHYNLSRYYGYFNDKSHERSTLERALPLFDAAPETVKRLKTRIRAEQRYSQVLINNKQFFAAEEQIQKGIGLYEDGLLRGILSPTPELGKLYSDMGDLHYFTQEGDMDMALQYYTKAEQSGYSPPEVKYRMGSAYYHQQKWVEAQERFVEAAAEMPFNRRILNTLGNISVKRGDYFMAQGYYGRLLDVLNADKSRFHQLSPQTRPDHYALAERLLVAQNNMGVVMEALTERTGDPKFRSQALDYYIDSSRAWDGLTRDPKSLVRAGMTDLAAPGVNLAYLNSQNAFSPEPGYAPQIYVEIDKDVLEPSDWELLAPQTARLTEP